MKKKEIPQIPDAWKHALSEFRWSHMLSDAVLILLGLILILRSGSALGDICFLSGAALTAYGALSIIIFLFSRNKILTFELILGILAIPLGIFAMVRPDMIQSFIQINLGLAVIVESLLGVKRALTMREMLMKDWAFVLVLNLAAAILGVLFIVYRELFGTILFFFVGGVFLYLGLTGLLNMTRLSFSGKRLKKLQPPEDSAENCCDHH